MRIILAGILSLSQYFLLLKQDRSQFCPKLCPHCGYRVLYAHGFYPRLADYDHCGAESFNPVPVFRFYCIGCKRTCSVLPECIAPHRHYPWALQQAALLLFLQGRSYKAISQALRPSRWTISRWIRRLMDQFLLHSDHLRSQLPVLASHNQFIRFWRVCLAHIPLSTAMLSLNNAGVVIP